MKKKRKIALAIILALGLYVNISSKSENNVHQTANSFPIYADPGPIGGDH